MATPIKNFSLEGIESLISEAGIPRFRSKQIVSWLYEKGVTSYDEMTNVPKGLREQLCKSFPLYSPRIVARQLSSDGTRKYLIEFHDGAQTEMVGLPSDDGRLTVCASSQAGCAMGCTFCATGQCGLTRSLFPGEIADQILLVQKDFEDRVSNVVVMGQGEPFSNFDNVIDALRILNNPKLLAIGARHITVSTCGLVKGIQRFSKLEEQFTLAVSLHAARQEIRDEIMPKLENQPLEELRHALKLYTGETGRRFTFEYALMQGINDSQADLDALIEYCKGLLCHVNLIPLNKIAGSPFKPVVKSTMAYWNDELAKARIPASIRKSRGADIDAACGQLAAKKV